MEVSAPEQRTRPRRPAERARPAERGACAAAPRSALARGAARLVAVALAASGCGEPSPRASAAAATPSPLRWRLVARETFDRPFAEPVWLEDRHGDDSPYHVDDFDDDGAFFRERGGAAFLSNLRSFRSFRASSTYGADGWLTLERYGRDSDLDGTPDSGGRLDAVGGKAVLTSRHHHDGVILRSTAPLPPRYRVEVTIGAISFGGAREGQWAWGGKVNGYDGDELAGPWFFREDTGAPRRAYTQNGFYFLCITDYARPAPHNNIFIHHHRKVVMDTDNNESGPEPGATTRGTWSKVYDPVTRTAEPDGSRYVSMIWLDGERPGHDWFGNDFVSYTPGGWQRGPVFVDKYLEGESYRFTIERDGERYTLSASGRFFHGGVTTYRASRRFTEPPVTWHYNQTAAELVPPAHDAVRVIAGKAVHTWPAGSAYPDHFLIGDPHINFYEGSAEIDDLELYVPEE